MIEPDARKSKADADFESFSAEDFFREAANKSAGRSGFAACPFFEERSAQL
jgi:hypothetical protein